MGAGQQGVPVDPWMLYGSLDVRARTHTCMHAQAHAHVHKRMRTRMHTHTHTLLLLSMCVRQHSGCANFSSVACNANHHLFQKSLINHQYAHRMSLKEANSAIPATSFPNRLQKVGGGWLGGTSWHKQAAIFRPTPPGVYETCIHVQQGLHTHTHTHSTRVANMPKQLR